ncbi:hypothetical protein N9V90_02730, partial [Endozoicomonas sp.]|nr:hypothetical protein [Endozoicomonas sp.]
MRTFFKQHAFSTFFIASHRRLTETTESVECASIVQTGRRVEKLLSSSLKRMLDNENGRGKIATSLIGTLREYGL